MEEVRGGQSSSNLVESRHLGPIPSKSPPEAEAYLHPAEYLRRFRLAHDRTGRKEGDRTTQERGRIERDGRDRPGSEVHQGDWDIGAELPGDARERGLPATFLTA